MASLAPAEKASSGKPLKVGSPHDPAEREADRIADILTAPEEPAMPVCAACAAGGAPCAACGGGGTMLRRSVAGPAAAPSRAPPSVARALAAAPGAPLPDRLRARFERRIGTDLSPLRLHQGERAEAAARSVDATAFALGPSIALGEGAPLPGAAAGERLLAHEVAHVVLGHAGLRRQTVPDAGAPATPAAPAPDSSAASSRTVPPPADPALEALTNADFLAEMVAARDAGTTPDRRAAVESERRRRVALGHEWLSAELDATPSGFYRLVPAGGVDTAVVRADAAQALGPPQDLAGAPIMTEAQFQRRLLERGIPTVAASMLGPVASGALGASLEMSTVRPGPRGTAPMPYLIADPGSAPPGMRTLEVRIPLARQLLPPEMLSGAAPSATYPPETLTRVRAGSPTVQDLALLLSVAPYDINQLRVLASVTSGEPTVLGFDTFAPNRLGYVDGYAESVEGTGGVGRAMLGERMVRALRLGQTSMVLEVNIHPRVVEGAAPGGPTAVERFHQEIQRAVGYDSGSPPTEGRKYHLDARQMARLAVGFGGAANAQEMAVLQRIAAGDMGAVAELAALPRPDLDALLYRARLESFERGGFADRFRARTASPLTPEWAAAAEHGPWAAGGRATVTGTGFGAALGLGLDAAFTAGGDGNWDAFAARAPRTLTLGAVGGGVSMTTEQALVSRSSAALMAEGAMPGLATGARLIGMRTIAAGAGAGVVELVLIFGFEDRPHSAREVVYRTTRSTGIGIVSAGVGTLATAGTTSLIGAILASGGTGAVGGSVVPGWGTAIGFVVGLGAGVLTYVVLDHALPRVEPTVP